MNKKIYQSREIIFRQGELGDSFFRVLRGSVMIILDYEQPDALVLAMLEKGQFFGEMAVIEKYARSATAVAGPEGAEVEEISCDETDGYLAGDPDLSIALMKHLGTRIADLTASYEDAVGLIREISEDPEISSGSKYKERTKKHARKRRSGRKSVDAMVNDKILLEKYGEHSKGYSKKVQEFPAGTVIVKEGMTGNCMYDIHWGRVGIYRGYGTDAELKITELYPNTFFGEMGLIKNEPRTATAVALEDTTLEVILEEDLRELFEKNPAKAGMIMAHLSNRLRKLTDQYEDTCDLVCKVIDAWDSNSPISTQLAAEIKEFAAKL